MATAVPASWTRRVNAATIDGLVCIGLAGAASAIAGDASVLRALRIALVFAPVLLLEPVLISAVGNTVGQQLLGLRVSRLQPGAPLAFPRLVLRYWTKLALGAPSLAYVMFSHRRQALHDRMFETLVWHVPEGADLPAQWQEPVPDPSLPPAWQRFAAFLGWSVVGQIGVALVIGLGLAVFSSDPEPGIAEPLAGAGAITTECWLLTRAARGGLLGARRRRARASGSETPRTVSDPPRAPVA